MAEQTTDSRFEQEMDRRVAVVRALERMERDDPQGVRYIREHLLALDDELNRYAATLRQQAGRVDEGMVERACAAFDPTGWEVMGGDSRADFKANMRAALTAALAQNTQGEALPMKEDRQIQPVKVGLDAYAWRGADGRVGYLVDGKDFFYPDFPRSKWPKKGSVVPLYLHAERARVPDDDVRWLLEQMRHDEFSHDYIKDEKACDKCKRIKRIAALIDAAPSQRAEVDVPERCEGGSPECGPVEHHDSEGVPLCATCWQSLLDDATTQPEDAE